MAPLARTARLVQDMAVLIGFPEVAYPKMYLQRDMLNS